MSALQATGRNKIMNQANYPRFLRSRPKVFGLDFKDVLITTTFVFILNVLGLGDEYTLALIAAILLLLKIFKKVFQKHAIYLLINKRNFLKLKGIYENSK
jgi:hypothetical protein